MADKKKKTDEKGLRKRPAWLRALGDADPPPTVRVAGRDYGLLTVFKHDSWAATALYADPEGDRITCKFNRMQPVFVIPMQWLGRILARREARFLQLLAPVALVPDEMGPVAAQGAPPQTAGYRSHAALTAARPRRDGGRRATLPMPAVSPSSA